MPALQWRPACGFSVTTAIRSRAPRFFSSSYSYSTEVRHRRSCSVGCYERNYCWRNFVHND
uniref:Uncharacterized protein n=1 Tax=Physcomitrium patens TaxID=3218 RepID=A0A2K1KIV8_PHYPA|nr:hypothetical protein PHYPA_007391 [Physcomitrium patens]